jgi:hypothetical protein
MPYWSNEPARNVEIHSPGWSGQCQVCDYDGELNGIITTASGGQLETCLPCANRIRQDPQARIRPPD